MSVDLSGPRQKTESLLGMPSNDSVGRRVSISQASIESSLTKRRSSLKKVSLAVMMGRRLSRKSQDLTDVLPEKTPASVPVENTYQLGPTKRHFPGQVTQVINEALQTHLEDVVYDGTTMGVKCKLISDYIKVKVKALDVPRYKIVCFVCITPLQKQGFQLASRSLWDHKTDNYASSSFQNGTLGATATVYWVYME